MNDIVIDASAILAMLKGEEGSDIVMQYLSHGLVSSVNLSEAATILIRDGMPKKETENILCEITHKIVEFTKEQAFIAAELYTKTHQKGLSFGDRACISLAQIKKLPVLTADKTWSKLKLPIKVELIR